MSMEAGGQAAEQIAHTGIQLTEEAIKLLASGSKNLAAFLLALAKDNKKVMGKTNMKRLLHDGREMKIFHIKVEDFQAFSKLAKKYGILYSGVKSTRADSGLIDIVTNIEYLPQVNHVLEVMGYPAPVKEAEPPKKADPCAPQEQCSPERRSGSTPTRQTRTPTSEKPSVRGRLASLEAASRSMRQQPERGHNKVR